MPKCGKQSLKQNLKLSAFEFTALVSLQSCSGTWEFPNAAWEETEWARIKKNNLNLKLQQVQIDKNPANPGSWQ